MNILQKFKNLFKERINTQSRLNVLRNAIERRYASEVVNPTTAIEIEAFFKSEFEKAFESLEQAHKNAMYKVLSLAFHPDKKNAPKEIPLTTICLAYFKSKSSQPGVIFQLLKDARAKIVAPEKDIHMHPDDAAEAAAAEANLSLRIKLLNFYLKLLTPASKVVTGSSFAKYFINYAADVGLMVSLTLPLTLGFYLGNVGIGVFVFEIYAFLPSLADLIVDRDPMIIDPETNEFISANTHPGYYVNALSEKVFNFLKENIKNPFGQAVGVETTITEKLMILAKHSSMVLGALVANAVVQPIIALYYSIFFTDYLARLAFLNVVAVPAYIEKNRGHLGSDFVYGVKTILFPLFALKNLLVNLTSDLKDGLTIGAKGVAKAVKASLVYSRNILSDAFANVIKTAFVIANAVKSVLKRSRVNNMPLRHQTLFLTAAVEEVGKGKPRATEGVVEENNVASPLLFSDESSEESFKSSNTDFNKDEIKMGLREEDKISNNDHDRSRTSSPGLPFPFALKA